MNTFYQLLALVGAGLIAWFIYRAIKGNPQQFSRENLSKSFSSMGILALVLIVFVAFLVLITRQ
ncbi:MAG: hypothetical protein K0U24_05090 [Gammaproteobacteria bacterium]|nr:hypothetical protein [Gammaproteobacteria bacterium]MCH9763592.1 hypothetical protein [Gammaproteobacteria bacterium]